MDADWVGNDLNIKSTIGFMFSFGSGAVNQSSKKQPIVALSNTKAEYRGASITICEIVWLQKLSSNLGQSLDVHIFNHCDDNNSILLGNDLSCQDKAR